jgi:signal transduction histidine kinase/ligand-binding sensor domain-containing protein/DNA-binding response OmpR family regulator
MMKKTLLIALFSIFLLSAPAQTNREGMLTTISYLFTVRGGLSSTKITSITQEDKGFFWIGTEDGLNRFDGYSFTIYKKQYGDSLSLISNHITDLFQDSRGKMWVATIEGLEYYEPTYDGFIRASLGQPDAVLKQNLCTAILEDRKGFLWFAASGVGVVRYAPETGESVLFEPSPQSPSPQLCSGYIRCMAEDAQGRIWFGSQGNGISIYDPDTETFQNYHTSNSNLPADAVLDLELRADGNMLAATLTGGVALYDRKTQTFANYPDVFLASHARTISCVEEDYEGNILVGTEGNGVFAFDPEQRTLSRYPILEEFSTELNDGNVSDLYIGHHDYVWIGLKYKGVFVAGNEASSFRVLKKINNNPNSLNYNYVTGITTDKGKDLWIATDGGGLNRYRYATRRFTHYTYRSDDPQSLRDNSVLSVFCDTKNRIWAGTSVGGLCLFDRTTERFTHHQASERPSEYIGTDYIKSIQEDQQGMLWLGTNGGGLKRFDPEAKTFRIYHSGEYEGLVSDFITILFADSRNNLWIGSHEGLSRMQIDNETFAAYGNSSGLGDQSVYSIGESPDGSLWVGTTDGLNRYDRETNTFTRVFPTSPRDMAVINGIVPDGQQLWLSTNRGVICYSIADGDVKTYAQSNSGVGSDEFLQGSYYKSPDGEVFFGGATGLSTFYPAEVQDSVTIQKVYLTYLNLSNEPVLINKEINGRVVLTRNISETKKITLRYSDKVFTLGFVAMGSYKSYSTVYACKLEGFDKEWVVYDYRQRSVTYTNLNPGTYTFRVKASSDPEVWGDEVTSLVIVVEPPLWNTWWAKTLYILLSLGVIYAVFRFFLFRIHEKNELRIQRIRVKQQEELNNVRTRFFTNISHEFRTPLTLILGPLKRMINEDGSEERKKAGLLILRNAERLQHLINQILDLNKIEEGQMRLHVQPLELVSFVSNSVGMFTELVRQKHISLTYAWKPDKIEVWYDPDMLDKCLSNLMYNAFKFTHEGGKIHVEVSRKDDGNVLLTVSDTGIGMSRETKERLFERFFQGDKHNGYTGTGIGMHLTKTIVELHKGTITVESEEGKGATFYLTIAAGNSHFKPEELEPRANPSSLAAEEETYMKELRSLTSKPQAGEKTSGDERPTLLLIEDNSDMRYYIRQELADHYVIEEAADGKAGLDKAHLLMPDLIITDVMMPEMSGTELCRILKADPETSHIPIVILTAQDDMEHRLEGVESGADSFITKPFSTRYLQVRVEKLIELRRKMKERFSKSIYMDAQEVTLTSMDERLLQKAIDYVRTNIENPNMSVELMSRELGMSRTHLHRKLKGLTGQSPVEFIKMIRMKQAAYLLTTGKLSVSEVGYRVGYNTPSYFSSSFNAHFGMSPTAYMERTVNNEQ